MNYGELGNMFYLILKGKVSVNIPQPVEQKEDQEEPQVEYREVAVLKDSSYFGELSLVTNKRVSATIICLEDSYFAVMHRDNFKRVLKQIEQKRLFEEMDFLRSIPLFANWNRRDLGRLTYFFSVKNFQRNNIVYNIGENPEEVYIVKTGTFEVIGRMEIVKDIREEISTSALIRYPYSCKSNSTIFSRLNRQETAKLPCRRQPVIIRTAAQGEIVGEEDCVLDRLRTVTLKCSSQNGSLIVIKAKEFLLQVKKYDETWGELLKLVNTKEKQIKLLFDSLGKFRESVVSSPQQKVRRNLSHSRQRSSLPRRIHTKSSNQVFLTETSTPCSIQPVAQSFQSKPCTATTEKRRNPKFSSLRVSLQPHRRVNTSYYAEEVLSKKRMPQAFTVKFLKPHAPGLRYRPSFS